MTVQPACVNAREEAAVAVLTRRAVPAPVRAHAHACPPCRDEFAQMEGMAPLLAAAGGVETVEPSLHLLPRLLREAARRRVRRRWVLAAVAATVAAAAVPIGIMLGLTLSRSPDPAAVYSAGQGRDPATGASAEVLVRPTDWGSQVEVEIYELPGGTPCQVVVVDRSGARVAGGSWTVPPEYHDEAVFQATVITRPAEVVAVELVDVATERTMLRVPVAPV